MHGEYKMTVTITPRPNIGSSGIIDDGGFEGFGSGGFDDDDLLIFGDEIDNILTGGAGHDKIEGEGGNDTITGGEGNDFLGGGAGDDDLDGQGGPGTFEKDKLFGDAGNDILRAGHGFDELTGGTGNDTFGFYAVGHFEVKDFVAGEDRLFFDSEKTNITNIDELAALVTDVRLVNVDDTNPNNDGLLVEFVDGAATITFIGITDVADLTQDIIFNL